MFHPFLQVLFTDSEASILLALELWFPDLFHRLCTWHLQNNSVTHVGTFFRTGKGQVHDNGRRRWTNFQDNYWSIALNHIPAPQHHHHPPASEPFESISFKVPGTQEAELIFPDSIITTLSLMRQSVHDHYHDLLVQCQGLHVNISPNVLASYQSALDHVNKLFNILPKWAGYAINFFTATVNSSQRSESFFHGFKCFCPPNASLVQLVKHAVTYSGVVDISATIQAKHHTHHTSRAYQVIAGRSVHVQRFFGNVQPFISSFLYARLLVVLDDSYSYTIQRVQHTNQVFHSGPVSVQTYQEMQVSATCHILFEWSCAYVCTAQRCSNTYPISLGDTLLFTDIFLSQMHEFGIGPTRYVHQEGHHGDSTGQTFQEVQVHATHCLAVFASVTKIILTTFLISPNQQAHNTTLTICPQHFLYRISDTTGCNTLTTLRICSCGRNILNGMFQYEYNTHGTHATQTNTFM